MELDEIDAETLGALVTGSREDVADYLAENDLPLSDMKALRQAEAAGRDRDRVLDLLNDRIVSVTVARELDVAERDVADVKSIIDRVADLEDVDGEVPDEYDTLDQETVLDLMGGTIDDLDAFLDSHALSASQIAYLLEAEQKVKDRKTAKQLLQEAMHDQVLAEDMARVSEDLDALRSDVSDLEADAAGDVDPERVEAARVEAADAVDYEALVQENIDDIQEEVRTRDLDLAALLEAEKANKDRVTLEEWLHERIAEQARDNGEDRDAADDTEAGADVPDGEDDQDGDGPEDEEAAETEDEDPGPEGVDADERTELVDDLVERFDYPRDRFDDMTLDDIRKIHDNLAGAEADEEEPTSDGRTEMRDDIDTTDLDAMSPGGDEREKTGAEQGKDLMSQLDLIDLKKNFGGRDDEEEDEEPEDEVEKRGLVSRLTGQVRGHVDRATDASLEETAHEDLERARELEDEHRAALLIAHVMKQFLEVQMGVQRELTYLEVAAELEASDIDTAHEDDIREFYQRMHLQEYKGEATVDVDEAHDLAEQVISDLS